MLDYLRSTPAQAVIWLTVLSMVCAVGIYVMQRVRRAAQASPPSASDLLTEFRAMQEDGELSPAEFHKVKGVLGKSFEPRSSSDDDEGDD